MKTFQQFQEQLSLSQAFQKIGKGRGVADAGEGISRSLESERLRVTSDRAKPKGSTSGVPTIPLNKATYQGRVEAGRNTPIKPIPKPTPTAQQSGMYGRY